MLTGSQPNGATWISLGKIHVCLMFVSHTKNVCKSQNTMKPLFLCYTLINNEVLLVPPVVLVTIDKPFNFQDFVSFLTCIYTPLKWFLTLQNGMYVSHKTSVLVTKKIFSYISLKLVPFSFRPTLNSGPSQCMPIFGKSFAFKFFRFGEKKDFYVFWQK